MSQLNNIIKKLVKSTESAEGKAFGRKLSKEEAEAAHDIFKLSPSMAREAIEQQARLGAPKPAMSISPLQEIENAARASGKMGDAPIPGQITKAADTVKLNQDPNFILKGEPYINKDPNFILKGNPYRNPNLPSTSMGRNATVQGEKSLMKNASPEEIIEDAVYREVKDITPVIPKKSNTSRNIGLGLAGIGALGLLTDGSEEIQNKEQPLETPEPPKEEPKKTEKAKNPYKANKKILSEPKKGKPSTIENVSEENADDKSLEQTMQNEDFVANESASEEGGTKAPEFEMDLGKQNYDVVDALNKAQEARDMQILWNNLGKISERGAAAIGGFKPLYGDVYDSNIKQADQKVQDVKDRMAQEGNDPHSQTSKAFKAYLAKMGVKVSGDMSAETGSKIVPLVFKDFEAKVAQEARAQQSKEKNESDQKIAEENRKSREFTAEENRKARIQAAKEAAENRKAMTQIKIEEKQDQMDTKRLDDLGKRLTSEIGSSRSAFGKAANNIRSAEAIEALANQYKDKGELDTRQVYELARSLDTLLSSGQGTITGTAHLIPNTYSGDLAKIVEYITNIPKGAAQGEFVKRTMETVEREKELAKEQIMKTQKKIMGPYIETLRRRPESARNILDPHGLGFMLDNEGSSEEAPDSAKAKKTIIKKGYNPTTNQTQFVYSDGTKEIVQGRK